MTLAISTDARLDGRQYKELPEGMFRWFAKSAAAPGTTTGETSINILFNPDQNEDFQPYVSLNSLTVATRTAAITILGVRVKGQGAEWEDGQGGTVRNVSAFSMLNFSTSLTFVGTMPDPVYFGRIVKGQSGTIVAQLQEINLTVYESWATGIWSEKPFLARDYLRT